MGIEKVILAFHSLLIKICLEERVLGLPTVNQFDEPKSTKDLGLIRDIENPMAKQSRQGAEIIVEIFRSHGIHSEATKVNNTDDTTGV